MSGIAILSLTTALSAQDAKPFTLQQVMSAPYANQLTPAPVGNLFAWVEDAEGHHNLWLGGNDTPARQLTHYTEDDGQDITRPAWAPDASAIAYTYGAPNGADGKPANPAHLQRATPLTVIIQPLVPEAKPITIGEGRNPLYSHDGKSLYFIRDGQIWLAELSSLPKNCRLDRSTTASSSCAVESGVPGERSLLDGVQRPASPGSPQNPTPRQLVFDRGSASSLTLSPDGNTLAFISRRRELNQPSHTFLALFDLRTHTLNFPAPSTGNDSAPAFSPDGKQLAWLRAPFTDTPEFALNRTSANPWSIQLLDLATNTTRTAYSPEPNKPGSVLPIPDDEAPYLMWDYADNILFYSETDGWNHLYWVYSKAALPPHPIVYGPFEVEGAIMTPDRRRVIFSIGGAEARTSPPVTWSAQVGDIATPDIRRVVEVDLTGTPSIFATPISAPRDMGTHPQIASDRTVAVLTSTASSPTQPAILQSTGNIKSLMPGEIVEKSIANSLVKPKQVIFPSTDNLQIHGQFFCASHCQPERYERTTSSEVTKHPAIVFLHGGPRRQMLLGYPAMEYYSNAYAMNQYLTSRGFIVLSVNYRCGIGYGLNFRQCDHEGATGAAEYNDVLAAAAYLRTRPDVDPKRIGLWGGSYGGYLTALALARNSDIFAAGVDLHGVHDWNLEDNAGDWKRGSNAEQDAIAAKALASSPLADLSKWHSPILLIHGDNDPSVAYAQTPLLADALRARNSTLPKDQQIDVQELIFPDEVHEFLLHKDWLAAYTAAAAFFERVLNPQPHR
jgi:dipeptidyl aminopeptidase/acylaminoacyl peptidase